MWRKRENLAQLLKKLSIEANTLIQKLFESGQLGDTDTKDPKKLQWTALFYTYLYFVKRGRENQPSLTSRCLSLAKHPRVDDILSCEGIIKVA